MTEIWVREVLDFWFGEIDRDEWYERKDGTDELIRRRFLDLYRSLQAKVPDETYNVPATALAAIIVFDQFPRNMFRGTAEAFSTDSLAVAIARNAIDRGFDVGMDADRKQFMYMPFMHSEVSADQERCIQLFAAAGSDTKYAVEHRDIIAKYGRFPHRNRALGRVNTEPERAFLGEHKGFGQ